MLDNSFFEELDRLAPGPRLAAYLTGVDKTRLNGHYLVVVMRAEGRMAAHYQAGQFDTMNEVSMSPAGGPDSPPLRDREHEEFAAAEVAADLHLTRRAAQVSLDLAISLKERLPRVWHALSRGLIDVPRARVMVYGTDNLDSEDARLVADKVLKAAPRLTTGQLQARIQRLCIEIDPEAAENRYKDSVESRDLIIKPTFDGTANIHAYGVPIARAAAIGRLINGRVNQLRGQGDPRSHNQLRCDVFLDFLDGGSERGSEGGGVTDIGIELGTLAGLNESPGEIPGMGPVIADIARKTALAQSKNEWRFTVTDNGEMVHTGITRRRPDAAMKRRVQSRNPTCVFMGCRRPSIDCDIDHTVAYSEGGLTTDCNLAPLCRYHHRAKHCAPWKLTRTGPGRYTWISRHGHLYITSGRDP